MFAHWCAARVKSILRQLYRHTGKDTDITALFSPSKKAWKKNIKTTIQNNPEGEFKRIKRFILVLDY